MELSRLVQCVLCLCLFVTIYGANTTRSNKRKPRHHRCRCKRVYKEINQAIDTKFKLLEERILNSLPVKSNDSLNLQEINSKMNKLHTEVQNTQDSLRRESQALRYVKEHMRAQSNSMQSLSESFGLLESVVRNLTKVVERLGAITPPSGLSNTLVSETVTPPSRDTTISAARATTASSVQEQTTHHYQSDSSSTQSYPRHCHEVYLNGGLQFMGEYRILIKPDNAQKPFTVLCRLKDNGGWTVFQRRVDGSENFYRNWTEYSNGFGDLGSEFWLGNKYLHQLTNQGRFQLRIDMEQWNGSKYYAIYDIFRISGEEDDFRLHVGGYHGTAGDSFTSSRDNHNGMRFSTFDEDHDRRPYDNCAVHYRGGWWYSDCFDSNLNGRYYQKGFHNNFFKRNGIQWNSIHNYSSLKFAEMMVRPSDDFLSHNKLSGT